MKSKVQKKCKEESQESRMLRELLETAEELSDIGVVSMANFENMRAQYSAITAPIRNYQANGAVPKRILKTKTQK